MLYSLDLFTGIGGLTAGMPKGIIPLAYCDNSYEAQKVLRCRMQNKDLPNAPICDDIKILTRDWLYSKTSKKPQMIVAGFPCIGFSTAGKKQGFKNDQSALFFELLRVIDEFHIDFLFLENVPSILRRGMHVIVKELVKTRKFDLYWCLYSASEVGAPHKRTRWFCLAIRHGVTFPTIDSKPRLQFLNWNREPVRMIINPQERHRERHYLLGNAVVPLVAQSAFHFLLNNAKTLQDNAIQLQDIKVLPENGTLHLHGNSLILYKLQRNNGISRDFHLVLDPKTFISSKPPNPLLHRKFVTRPVKLKVWGTPTSNTRNAANFLTERSKIPLHTQVRFERRTPNHLRHGKVSPEFVEWMMGFPTGWTVVS